MEERKPVRRSPELTPLSHDHHDALLFVWKLRQGVKNGTNMIRIAGYITWYWQNHLQQHFELEENILASHFPLTDPLFSKMMEDHTIIRGLVDTAKINPATDIISRLADTIYDHVRFEERTLFPYAEKELAGEQLQKIAFQLAKKPVCNTDWDDEFWTGKQ